MRKLLVTIAAVLVLFVQSFAQADNRALSTKIADLLAMLPAQNQEQLDKSMQSITALGSNGLDEMLAMLTAPGKSDNTSLEYAIAGYAFYLTGNGREAERKQAVAAYCKALDAHENKFNKDFFIRQLQIFGKDDAVGCIQKYIGDEFLAGPSARALAMIGTASADNAINSALASATGANRLSLIEALGYARYKGAGAAISSSLAKAGIDERKVSLYALARIADPASLPVLESAAKAAGYGYDEAGSTTAFLMYLRQLAATGNTSLASAQARKLAALPQTSKNIQTRTAGLKLYTDLNGAKAIPALQSAMKDGDAEYRAAALKFAAPFSSKAVDQQWVSTLKTASPAAQAQILQALATTGNKSLVPSIQSYLKSANQDIRLGAIEAVGRLGQQDALPSLLGILKTGNSQDVAAVKSSLLRIKGDQFNSILTNSLDKVPAAGKVALTEVLAARGASEASSKIFAAVADTDTAVHRAAVNALAQVAGPADADKLYELLSSSSAKDVPAVQKAIVNATAGGSAADRTTSVLSKMNSASADKQPLFYGVLSAIGGTAALSAIEKGFYTGDAQAKKAAIAALSTTNSKQSAETLLKMARQSGTADVLTAYLDVVGKTSLPGSQKVLMLRDAMELAKSDDQRKRILEMAGRTRTFEALVFAGNYIDNAALQQEAAMAVMNSGLSNNEFTGEMVRSLLTKAMGIIKGQDSDYQRQAIKKRLDEMPAGTGFVPMFNGKDLTGWKGLVENPIKRSQMDATTLAAAQKKADEAMRTGWIVKDGLLIFTGHGENLCTEKLYGDFDMYVDWKITKDGDAGIYLRGTPQVQIWDTSRTDAGAQVGSGGLYNNQKNPSKPLAMADNGIGEWNTFHITMRGDKVTVYENGVLVVDNVPLENYWDRNMPIFAREQIELQAHGTYVAYRNLYIKELPGSQPFVLSDQEKSEGFQVLFDGANLDKWTGNKVDYVIDHNELLIDPKEGSHGNLYTKDEFGDFVYRFEFQLTPGANNGIGIRAPLEGDAAYVGMEIQVLDNEADIYKNLKPYQYHGSVYGVIPAKRGFLKPTGEWNVEEIYAKGSKIRVTLNGTVILDGDIAEASKNGTADHNEHPGLKNQKGHIGFLGHGSVVRFRNIRIKTL